MTAFFKKTDFKDLMCQKFLFPAGYVEMAKKKKNVR